MSILRQPPPTPRSPRCAPSPQCVRLADSQKTTVTKTPIPSFHRAHTPLARRPRPHNSTPFRDRCFLASVETPYLKTVFGFSSTQDFAAAEKHARQESLICSAAEKHARQESLICSTAARRWSYLLACATQRPCGSTM